MRPPDGYGAVRPTFGSLFSGIGGFDRGLELAGWECSWQVEIDKYRTKVLERHWPDVKRYGDITKVDGAKLQSVDLICGGFPCQDLSVAGARKGLAGERSALFFEFARLLNAVRPRWCLIENVPGLLSSNHGRDFAIILNELAKCGYWWSFRILDSRYFGVAQRRRRVFIVGHLRGPCPPEVLFEPESLPRDTPQGGQAGKDVAPSIRASTQSSSSGGPGEQAYALNGRSTERYDGTVETFHIQDARGVRDKRQNGIGISRGGPTYTLDQVSRHAVAYPLEAADGHHGRSSPRGDGADNLVAYRKRTMEHGKGRGDEAWEQSERSNILTVDQRPTTLIGASADPDGVREATGVPRRMDGAADGKRYAALGDAVTVPVISWIGRRILEAL